MPVSSGHGKWPTEYGVGVKDDRITTKCGICTQKNCFSCEHNVAVRNAIFSHQPYLDPKEDFSIADRNDPKRRAFLEEQERERDKNSSGRRTNNTVNSDRKIRPTGTDSTSTSRKGLNPNGVKSKANSSGSSNQKRSKAQQDTSEKKSKCTIL